MLIKLYTCDFPESIHILDNAKDVVIHQNCFSGDAVGPAGNHGPLSPTTWVEFGSDIQSTAPENDLGMKVFRFVDYTRDGVRCRLKVDNMAYICNDEGKTIEKIKMR